MKFLKLMKIYFIFFFCIILLLFLSMLLPKKMIKYNAKKSINYAYKELIKTKANKKYPYYLETDDGDLKYSEMVYLVNPIEPFKSMIEMNSYITGNLNDESTWSYHEYARYWHGPILYLRPLMIIYSLKEIYTLQFIVLVFVFIVVIILLYRFDKFFLVSTIITFGIFSVYSVYHNVSYFNCMILSMIGGIVLLYLHQKKKLEKALILFMILGLLTCFFDFYTIDTITITFPLLIYILILKKEEKEIKAKKIIQIIIIWFISYFFPYIVKWGISSLLFGRKIIFDVLYRTKVEGFDITRKISIVTILHRNLKCIIPFYYMNNYELILIPLVLLGILISYFYLNKDLKKGFLLVLILCMLRILLVPIQASTFTFTTFRNLIPVFIMLFYIILKGIYPSLLMIKKILKFHV